MHEHVRFIVCLVEILPTEGLPHKPMEKLLMCQMYVVMFVHGDVMPQ